MKEETGAWLNRARDHLRKAKDNFRIENYDLASFLSHQVVELALKSFLIEKKGEFPRVHDLVRLGKLVGIDQELLEECEFLTFVYTEARYPDTGLREYTKEEAEKDIAIAQRILEWIVERVS